MSQDTGSLEYKTVGSSPHLCSGWVQALSAVSFRGFSRWLRIHQNDKCSDSLTQPSHLETLTLKVILEQMQKRQGNVLRAALFVNSINTETTELAPEI